MTFKFLKLHTSFTFGGDLDETLDVNLGSGFYCCLSVVRHLTLCPYGQNINPSQSSDANGHVPGGTGRGACLFLLSAGFGMVAWRGLVRLQQDMEKLDLADGHRASS